jgi:hypothetical protein
LILKGLFEDIEALLPFKADRISWPCGILQMDKMQL